MKIIPSLIIGIIIYLTALILIYFWFKWKAVIVVLILSISAFLFFKAMFDLVFERINPYTQAVIDIANTLEENKN